LVSQRQSHAHDSRNGRRCARGDSYKRLYVSRDEKGKILKPINESVHESVLKRFKQQVVILNGDDDKKGSRQGYNPKNLAAAIAQSQQNLSS